jgi:hypothetical protein
MLDNQQDADEFNKKAYNKKWFNSSINQNSFLNPVRLKQVSTYYTLYIYI